MHRQTQQGRTSSTRRSRALRRDAPDTLLRRDRGQARAAATPRPPRQGHHHVRPLVAAAFDAQHPRAHRALRGRARAGGRVVDRGARTSSSASGCSSRSSRASSCCRPRSASSHPVTSSCRSGIGSGIRSGSPAKDCVGAALIVIRVATSISLVVLVALTTSWTALLAALRSLFLPRMFVLVLGMAYRYVFYLLGIGHRHVRGPQSQNRSSRRRR